MSNHFDCYSDLCDGALSEQLPEAGHEAPELVPLTRGDPPDVRRGRGVGDGRLGRPVALPGLWQPHDVAHVGGHHPVVAEVLVADLTHEGRLLLQSLRDKVQKDIQHRGLEMTR